MKVSVKLLGVLREKAGSSSLVVELPDRATVRDLIRSIVDRYPRIGEVLSTEGEDLGIVQVLINGRNIQWLDGLDTRLKPSDEIVLLPPAGGG